MRIYVKGIMKEIAQISGTQPTQVKTGVIREIMKQKIGKLKNVIHRK